ncbi:hypothetical protein SLS62_000793 [Diatrype stigma]|uniref:Protein BIG1 n=1 Tax=Diatrype stigma TaxID=117547 RepID=A0AAN9V9X7_9PEZI
MRVSTTGALAALCASARAFSDSSPFILFSTAKLPGPVSSSSEQPQLQSSSQVVTSAKGLLKSCPTTRYLLVSQSNLNAAHLPAGEAVPHIYRSLQQAASRFSVAEVAGHLDVEELSSYIREVCDGKGASVEELDLEPLALAQGATTTLKENDDHLALILDQYASEGSYTVIYTAGPRTEKPKAYTAEFQDNLHVELKRQVQQFGKRANVTSDLPLFEKYQFFTPAIFMGLLALVVLLSILYTGISALSSLEVSYGAFDKEMGPAAQKKQQ